MAPRLALALLLTALLAITFAACRGSALTGDAFGVQEVDFDVPYSETGFVPTLDGPLRLIAATPHGSTTRMLPRQPVAATFSRPMVPLGDPPQPDAAWLTIEPGVAGSLAWDGTQTLVFTPDQPWPAATAFSARLAAGITSLDGEAAAQPVQWSFETPRPAVIASDPAPGEPFADPAQTLVVTFNQAIDQRRAPSFVRLRTDAGRAVDVRVAASGDSAVTVTPRAPLAPATSYQLELQQGLPSAEGPLPMRENATIRFTTYGPLTLTAIDQPIPDWQRRNDGAFDPQRGIQLTFSTPVAFEEVRRAFATQPAVDLPPGIEARDGRVATTHTLPIEWEPETSYTLAMRPITDVFGQRLDGASGAFRTRALEPHLQMPQGILVIEADEQPVVPLRATNVAEARLAIHPLAIDDIIPIVRTYDRNNWYGALPEGRQPPPARTANETLAITLPRNRPGIQPLDIRSHLRDGTGVAAIRVHQPSVDTERDDFRAIAQVTRMGITAKFSPHQNLVLVTDLRSGAPLAGAHVSIRDIDNREHWRGTTDRDGRALAPGWAALGMTKADRWQTPVQFAFAEYRGDLAFTASVYNDGVEPYRFDVRYDWNPEPQHVAGSVFTDRGLYRAGETVFLKAILRTRTEADWRPASGDARLVIRNPRDEVVLDRLVAASDMGSLDLDWTPAPDAAHGLYVARLAAPDDTTATDPWSPSAWAEGSFRVDSFRRATFEVNPTASAPAYVAGDTFEGLIEARYLFGASMGNQPVRARLFQTDSDFAPPGFDAFRFGSLDRRYRYDELLALDTLLSDDGRLARNLRLQGTDAGTPLELAWEATVTDPARQTQSASRRIILHPGLFYVGLRPRTTYLDLRRDARMEVDLITVDPAGAPLGDREVAVELVRRQWNSVREVGTDGRLRWRSERTEEVLGRQRVTTTRGRMSRVSLPVEQGGHYVVRAIATDIRGNTVRSEAFFWAAGSGYVAWERADDDRIDLIPEKNLYSPGETARLMVQSPYESATALVTVEREGIISSRVVTLEGSAPQIEVPLTEDHLPNVFVSVVLLHGRTARPEPAADPGAPSYKMGYATLRVDAGARRLNVAVTPDQDTFRPGEEVTVDLRLTDARGRGVPGEITFSAADAAVLNLVGYRLPDPFDAFYGPRPLAVTTSVTLANLVRQRSFGQKEEDQGGGGGDRSDLMRRDFRPLAHWAPAIHTDRSGRARVTFRVPESLTTFRLMATAHTADHRFGNGIAEIVVQKPLVLQAALPRFARTGDTFEAGVLVTNLTGAPGEATVTAEAASGVTRTGPAEQRIQLAAGETREARFRWRADASGEPELRFTARLADERDAFATVLPVALPTIRTRTGTFASTDGRAAEALRLPEDAVQGLGGLRVTLASTALAGLDGAARYLFQFPYGCVEQQTSRVRPLLTGAEILEAFDLTVLDGNRDAIVRQWLADLEGFWTGEGFAMWRGQSWANPYASAYVVLALAEARDAGYHPPARLTADAVAWLEQAVRNRSRQPDMYDAAVWDASRALMLYALARHGRILTAEVNEMAGRRDRLAPETLAHLLRTVTLGGGSLAEHRTPLAQLLRQRVRAEATGAYVQTPETGYWGWIFASDVRATALTMTALTEADPSNDTRALAERMIQYLMRQQTGAAWPSTQDNATVIDAFRAYVAAFEREAPALTGEIRLAGQRLLRESFDGRTLRVADASRDLSGLARGQQTPLAVEATGQGRLYYSVALDTYSAEPQQARSNGLQIARTIQPLDNRGEPAGAPLAGREAELPAGQLVRVTIRLTSPATRHYVVVDDALPAGLEALNAAFETTETLTRREDQFRWWGSFNHAEIHDDRVLLFADYLTSGEHTYTYLARATTPGTFTHPPAQAEEMYNPEVMARTASGAMRVTIPNQTAGR